MVRICYACEKGLHKFCRNKWTCDCQCNVNTNVDVAQKGLAIAGGAALAIGGLAFTICTGGLGGIIIGGAMLGAGVSSTWNGAEKAIKGERINGKTYVADVAFGAVTGLATGGVGAAGETIAVNVVKQGAKEVAKAGAKKLAVRATTGIITGVTAKALDEVKQCSTTDKQWSDYGKSFDENGKENGTAASWIASAAVGGLGGASSHVSSNLTKSMASGVAESVTRVAVSGTTAAVGDATIQGFNIAVGNQDEYDVKRTVTSVTASVIMTTAQEGTKNAIYHANGGKYNMLNDKSNRKLIEEKVPEKDQQKVMDGYGNLKKISQSTLNDEATKAASYTQSQTQKASSKDFKPTSQKSDIHKMNSDNAHFLTKDKVGQVAIDVKSSGSDARGTTRATFDCDTNNQGRTQFKFSGYTDKHDYSKMPNPGEGDYYKVYQNYENNLNNNLQVASGQINNLIYNQSLEDEHEKKEKED